MAYVNSEMHLMDYTGALKLFAYVNSAGDTITAANFFNSALVPQNLKVGDLILAKNIGELHRVSAISAGVVTVVLTT